MEYQFSPGRGPRDFLGHALAQAYVVPHSSAPQLDEQLRSLDAIPAPTAPPQSAGESDRK